MIALFDCGQANDSLDQMDQVELPAAGRQVSASKSNSTRVTISGSEGQTGDAIHFHSLVILVLVVLHLHLEFSMPAGG